MASGSHVWAPPSTAQLTASMQRDQLYAEPEASVLSVTLSSSYPVILLSHSESQLSKNVRYGIRLSTG